jgi:hypothetical protein
MTVSTKLTLDKSITKVEISNSGCLTVISGNSPVQELKWFSSNTSVVTVDIRGNYTGKSKGIADVIVKTVDGKKEGSCKIYVYPKIDTVLGRGINILEAETITTNFIKRNNPVIDIDLLNAMGKIKQDTFSKRTTFECSIKESVVDVVNEFNTKNNVSYAGAFSVSANVNFDTKKTENRTSKFIKAMGQVRTKEETILNTSMDYLKDFLTEQFKKDCTNKTADDMLATYGSHVIADCYWGGIAMAEAMYTSTKITDKTKLEIIVKGSFGGFSGSSSNTSTQDREHFKKNTTEKISAWGGSNSNMSAMSWDEFAKKYDSWYTSITSSNCTVCGVDLFNEATNMLPLWNFVNLVSPVKATQIKNVFNARCTARGIALKGLVVYAPVVTDVNVFAKSGSNYTTIPSPYNHVVLNAFADRENNVEAFEEKKNQILDCNKNAGGSYINMFYTTSQIPKGSTYTGKAISDIIVINGKNAIAPTGYVKIGVDLNQGAGGDYLYLAYKRTTAADTEVVDFIGGAIYTGSTLPNTPGRDDGRWDWVYQRTAAGVSQGVADLNKGCGTKTQYIRLLVHKIPRQG